MRGRWWQLGGARVGLVALVASVAVVVGGCESSGGASGSGAQRGADGSGLSYEQAYTQGRYAQAYDEAARVAGSRRGKDRERAALIAGLSAQAERWLKPLVTVSDPAVQGGAAAALGLMASDATRHEEAARLLELASRRLKGDDAARAAMYAGDSLKALSRDADAKASWERARDLVVRDASLRMIINDRLAGQGPLPLKPGPVTGRARPELGRFSVQAGAFQSLRDAQRRAEQVAAFGATRVVERTDRTGRTLFAVRVGQFPTSQSARDVARQIGSGAFPVTTDDERAR
jgi:hypothetical protein